MKKRCAVFTIVKNEKVFLPMWLRYYKQFFDNQDIYILDHESTDHSTLNLDVNVNLITNEYVSDHEWMVKVVEKFQRELLTNYQCVIFAESDEFIYTLDKSFSQSIDEFISSDELYLTVQGYSIYHNIQTENALKKGDFITEKRNHWYKDPAEDKTLISKIPLEWTWGFHRLRYRGNNYNNSWYLAHLHRFDLPTMVDRHQTRTSFKQKQDGGGTHWKSDEKDIFDVFQQTASQPILIPDNHKKALAHLTF